MIRLLLYTCSYTSFLVVCLSCAQVISPGGGPKDENPPFMISSIPLNNQVNYKKPTIQLNFNEWIADNNIKGKLIITPYRVPKYTYSIHKKTFNLIFEETLDDSTTYTLNFREGIVDITEKNPAKDVKLAFSTGSYIDSLAIQGLVTDMKTGVSVEDASVLLYSCIDTFEINRGNPTYYTQTNKEGRYRIDNISGGEYAIYALLEKDKNLYYTEDKEEKISFMDTSITIEDSLTDINMQIVSYDDKIPMFLYVRNTSKYVYINYNKPIKDYRIHFFDTSIHNSIYHKLDEDKIQLYTTLEEWKDTAFASVVARDYKDRVTLDTIKVNFKLNNRSFIPDIFTIRSDPSNNYLLEPNKEIDMLLYFNKPVISYSIDSIFFLTTKDSLYDTLYLKNSLYSNFNSTVFTISNLSIDTSITMVVGKSSFVSVENDTLEYFSLKWGVKNPENYGTIAGNITLQSKSNYLVQLT